MRPPSNPLSLFFHICIATAHRAEFQKQRVIKVHVMALGTGQGSQRPNPGFPSRASCNGGFITFRPSIRCF